MHRALGDDVRFDEIQGRVEGLAGGGFVVQAEYDEGDDSVGTTKLTK
jgi:hypothetical protein